jgi:hypothetical protein
MTTTNQPPKTRSVSLYALLAAIWAFAAVIIVGSAFALPDDMLRTHFNSLLFWGIGGAAFTSITLAGLTYAA